MRGALVIGMLVGCGRVSFDAAIDAPPVPLQITKLTLHDAETNAVLLEITDGAKVDVANSFGGVTVQAEVDGAGSVEFVRNGEPNTEATAPYLSAGNENENFHPDNELLVGENTIAVTAYELPALGGARGPTKTVAFTLSLSFTTPPAIARTGIFNDPTNGGFIELVDGMTYPIGSFPAEADLRIETTPSIVGSVAIGGVGPWTSAGNGGIENHPPYTAMGSNDSFTPAVGTYTLTARAYPLGNGRGEGGPPFSVTFSIGP